MGVGSNVAVGVDVFVGDSAVGVRVGRTIGVAVEQAESRPRSNEKQETSKRCRFMVG